MKEQTITSKGRSIKVYDVELVLGMLKQWVDSGLSREEALTLLMDAGEEPTEDDLGYLDALVNNKFLEAVEEDD